MNVCYYKIVQNHHDVNYWVEEYLENNWILKKHSYDVVDYFSNICECNNLETNFKDNNDNVLLYGLF